MRRVFADTWLWIAVLNPRYSAHRHAIEALEALREATILTTEEVLSEFLTYYSGSGRYWRERASSFVAAIIEAREVEILPQTHSSFVQALELYGARLDKQYSFVDCSSMQVMRSKRLTKVLTGDSHFRQEGFELLLPQLQ